VLSQRNILHQLFDSNETYTIDERISNLSIKKTKVEYLVMHTSMFDLILLCHYTIVHFTVIILCRSLVGRVQQMFLVHDIFMLACRLIFQHIILSFSYALQRLKL
jgi:hypothetical protein